MSIGPDDDGKKKPGDDQDPTDAWDFDFLDTDLNPENKAKEEAAAEAVNDQASDFHDRMDSAVPIDAESKDDAEASRKKAEQDARIDKNEDPYKILGVDKDVDRDELLRVIRELRAAYDERTPSDDRRYTKCDDAYDKIVAILDAASPGIDLLKLEPLDADNDRIDNAKTHYEVLGVTSDALLYEIQDAYEILRAKYSLLILNSDDVARLKLIDAAWDVLSDYKTRKEYDESLNPKDADSDRIDNAKTHYEVLGVQPDASSFEMMDEYDRLCSKYGPGSSQSDKEKLKKCEQAWFVLGFPSSREAYDESLNPTPPNPTNSSSSQPSNQPQPASAPPNPAPNPAQRDGWLKRMGKGTLNGLRAAKDGTLNFGRKAGNALIFAPAVGAWNMGVKAKNGTVNFGRKAGNTLFVVPSVWAWKKGVDLKNGGVNLGRRGLNGLRMAKDGTVNFVSTQGNRALQAWRNRPNLELGKNYGKAVLAFRKQFETSEMAKVSATGRSFAGGAAGVLGANVMTASSAVQNVMYGGLISAPIAGVALAGPLTAAAAHGVRRGIARWLHEQAANDEFEKACGEVEGATNGKPGAAAIQWRQNLIDSLKKSLDMKDSQLVNTDEEQDLLLGFHAADIARPSQVPYMVTVDRYAKFCLNKLREACEKAANGTLVGPDAKELKAMKSYTLKGCEEELMLKQMKDLKTLIDKAGKDELSGTDPSKELLDKIKALLPKKKDDETFTTAEAKKVFDSMVAINAGPNPKNGINPGELQDILDLLQSKPEAAINLYKEKCEQLVECSVAYGRLLSTYHMDQREAQMTWGVLMSSAASSITLVNPLPAVGGAAYLLTRKALRAIRANDSYLKIDAKGDLVGKDGGSILSPEVRRVKGGALYRPDILRSYREATQLSHDESEWLGKITIPADILNQRFATIDDFAIAAGPAVQDALSKVDPPAHKADEHDVADAKDHLTKCRESHSSKKRELQEARLAHSSAEDEFQAATTQIERESFIVKKQLKPELDSAGQPVLDRAGKPQMKEEIVLDANGKPEYVQAQLSERLLIRVRELEGKRDNAETRKTRADRLIKQLEAEVLKAEEAEKKAEAEYKKIRKPSSHKLSIEKIGQNESVIRAFCVKMHQLWPTIEDRNNNGYVGSMKKFAKGAASGAVGAVGGTVAKAAAYSGVSGGAAWIAANAIPGAATFISPQVALSVGAFAGLVQFIRSKLLK